MAKMKKPVQVFKMTCITVLVSIALCLTACGSRASTAGTDGESGSSSTAAENGQVSDEKSDSKPEEVSVDMDCENRYMELLGIYLKEQLELEHYDKAVEDLGCLPLDKEKQSDAQKRGNMGLTFLYLRNDLHLERLTEEDVKVLKDSLGKEEGEERDKAMEVVVRTFPVCTMPVLAQDDEEKNFTYVYDNTVEAQSGARNVTIDSLVIQIATQSDYDDEGEYVDPEKEQHKREELYKLAEQMEYETEGLLGEKPIRVLIDFIF